MPARSSLPAACAVVLLAALVGPAAVAAPSTPTVRGTASASPRAVEPPGPGPRALQRLEGDARVPLRTQRDADGSVVMVRGSAGRALVARPSVVPAGPRAAARWFLGEYGAALGVQTAASDAGDLDVVATPAGGHVVRAQQEVAGLPVVAGEVVVILDRAGGLVSMAGETTSAGGAATTVVARARALATAVRAAEEAHHAEPGDLVAVSAGQWLYDPALVGVADPGGVRPVWRVEVRGPDVRDLVLVDAARGGVALRVDQRAGLTRRVCDRANQALSTSVPSCSGTAVARDELTGPTGRPDVDAAFDHVGATSALYAALGLDLAETVGVGAAGSRAVESWVRWCDGGSGAPCPMPNAFWDGSRMVLGEGFAQADDVVAHELTHAVIDRTSRLLYLHQSGALSESLADVMGELVDQRDAGAGEDDTGWELGEDAPGGAVRSMQDPTLHGQPDRMRSPLYGAGDAAVDNGEVHLNSGVGNKTAYLISRGGSFNGVTVAGIDGTDAQLTKSATLYGQVMLRLTSGAEYADLGRALVATCEELSATATAGFVDADCAAVRAAVGATELLSAPVDPAAAAPEADASCPTGQVRTTLFRDEVEPTSRWVRTGNGYDAYGRLAPLWTQTPGRFGAPTYATSGTASWFGLNPDPTYGDPSVTTLEPETGVTVPDIGRTYLHFRHAHLLEWYPPADADGAATYRDGGVVSLQQPSDTGWRPSPTPTSWVNGPDKEIRASAGSSPWTGFGGDSHGWGSSRLELSSLAGRTVRPQWRIVSNASVGYLGWYVDDVEIYHCDPGPSGPVRSLEAVGSMRDARLWWSPPADPETPVHGYRVTRSDGEERTLAADASTVRMPLVAGDVSGFTVAALGPDGRISQPATVTVRHTVARTATSATRIAKGQRVKVVARLRDKATKAGVGGQYVVLQRRSTTSTRWRDFYGLTTRADGTQGVRITLPRTSYLRVFYRGGSGRAGTVSSPVKVRVS